VVEKPIRQRESERVGKDLYGDPLPPGAVARLGTVRFRHSGGVDAIACSPDGKTLATAVWNVISLWDMATGKEIRQHQGHQSLVYSLAYSADGMRIASGSLDKTIRLWDAATGKELHRFEVHQEKKQTVTRLSQVLFTPDGKRLLSTGADDTIRLWDVATGKEVRRFEGHREPIWTIALSVDGTTLAAFSKEPRDKTRPGEVRLWDVATGKTQRHWMLPDDVRSVLIEPDLTLHFSPDLRFLVTCYRDGAAGPQVLKLWDVNTGKVVRTFPVGDFPVGSIRAAFSADGNTLISGGAAKTIRLWDVHTGKELRQFKNPYPSSSNFPSHVTLGPDGKTLISWGFKSAIHFVDLATGEELHRFEGHDRAVAAVAFSPYGKRVASGAGGEVHLWDPAAQRRIHRIAGLADSVTAVAFAPDGKTLLSGSGNLLKNGKTYVWNVASGREILSKALGLSKRVMAFSADGKIAATSDLLRSELRLWDVATGKALLRLPGRPEGGVPRSVAFSPDGRMLAAAGGFDVPLWEVATGKELIPLGKHGRVIDCVAFSPDGRLLGAVERVGKIHLWETATRRERLVVDTGGNVSSIAFSPDGRFLATANYGMFRRPAKDGKGTGNEDRDKVFLVDLATGKVVHRFGSHNSGHYSGVVCLAFSPDGKLLASGGRDTTTLLWDVAGVVPKERPLALSAGELKGLWADLAGADAARAHRAVWAFKRASAQTVPFLQERVHPVPVTDPQVVARLLAEFGSERFAERQQAAEALDKLGVSARPALRKALEGKPALEVSRRIELLLERPDRSSSPQALRAAEVLEHIGTAEARRVLETLATGAPEARLTISARAALERLSSRAAAP
jgi:WD40 repeat protein